MKLVCIVNQWFNSMTDEPNRGPAKGEVVTEIRRIVGPAGVGGLVALLEYPNDWFLASGFVPFVDPFEMMDRLEAEAEPVEVPDPEEALVPELA